MDKSPRVSPPNGSRIDWDEVHERLERSQRSLESAFAPDTAKVHAILTERAQQYADRDIKARSRQKRGRPIMQFMVGGEHFGIELSRLSGVVPIGKITPLPEAAPEVLGLTNSRGELWVILELCHLLKLPGETSSEGSYALLLRCDGRRVAIRADRTGDIVPLKDGELTAAGDCTKTLDSRYAEGLMPGDVTLLNAAAFCTHLSEGGTD